MEIQCKTLLVSTSSKLHFMYGYYNFSFNYSGIQILSTSPQKWNFSKQLGFQQNQLSENGFWSKLSRCIREWFMDLDIEMLRQSYTGWKLLKILKSQRLSYSYNYLFAISQPRNVDHSVVHGAVQMFYRVYCSLCACSR